MSFCQKHRNHHCVHAHQCKNPQHKLAKKENIVLNKSNKSLKTGTLAKIVQQNQEQCEFNYQPPKIHKNQNKGQRKDQQYEDSFRKQYKELVKKYDKLNQSYRHASGQLEYYQNQILRIIKCSDTDLAMIVKQKVKTQASLVSKIKFLEQQLQSIAKNNQELTELLEVSRKNNLKQKQCIDSIKQEQSKLIKRLNQYKNQKQQLDRSNQGHKKQSQFKGNQCQILKQQFEITNKKQSSIIRKLKENLQEIQLKNIKLVQELKSQKELKQLQMQQKNEIISNLKTKTQKKQEIISKYQSQCQLLKKNLLKTQGDLKHSKKVLQKYIKGQNQRIIDSTNKENVENKEEKYRNSEIIQQSKKNTGNNEGNLYSEEMSLLKKQLEQLRGDNKRLKELYEKSNPGNSLTVEQYILNVGASQAFRRIIVEKNDLIKKLIREKAQILNS